MVYYRMCLYGLTYRLNIDMKKRQIQQMFSVEEGEISVNGHYKTHFDFDFCVNLQAEYGVGEKTN